MGPVTGRRFAEPGAAVVLAGVNEAGLEAAARELTDVSQDGGDDGTGVALPVGGGFTAIDVPATTSKSREVPPEAGQPQQKQ
jgi:hypothetical protein